MLLAPFVILAGDERSGMAVDSAPTASEQQRALFILVQLS